MELDSPRPRCKKKKAFWMFSQTSSFVFVEARKWYGFGTTWEWVNDDAVFFFWMNYEVSHLDSFGIFLEPHVEVTWHFPLICIFFFFFLRSYLHNNMNFLFHNVCLHKKRPDLQIHRHLNVKYYSAKAGLWPFVIILQYKVAKKKKILLNSTKS